ncbi:MAG: hypothetical protein ACU0DK_17655 [Pseudooceanicola sp.]
MRHITLIAAAAILLGGTLAAQANTGFACSFLGGVPGQPDAEGNTGPFQPNGVEYRAEAQTLRDASRAARTSCTATEGLGAQGCILNGCTDLASAQIVVPSAAPGN